MPTLQTASLNPVDSQTVSLTMSTPGSGRRHTEGSGRRECHEVVEGSAENFI